MDVCLPPSLFFYRLQALPEGREPDCSQDTHQSRSESTRCRLVGLGRRGRVAAAAAAASTAAHGHVLAAAAHVHAGHVGVHVAVAVVHAPVGGDGGGGEECGENAVQLHGAGCWMSSGASAGLGKDGAYYGCSRPPVGGAATVVCRVECVCEEMTVRI